MLLVEPIILFAVILYAWSPRPGGAWLLVVVPLAWIARRLLTGRFSVRTWLDVPVAAFLLLLPLSLVGVADWERATPKLVGIVLGLGLTYALVNCLSSTRRLVAAVLLTVLILGPAIALFGAITSEWPSGGDKLLPLQAVYERLPRLIADLPGRPPGSSVNRNETAGALLFFVPLALAAALGLFRGTSAARRAAGAAVLLAFAAMAFVLVLTQSRSALIGAAGGTVLVVVGAFARRRTQDAARLSLFLGVAVLLVLGAALARASWSNDVIDLSSSVAGRNELWFRSFYMLEDSPYVGVGLGQFPRVVTTDYATYALGAGRTIPFGPLTLRLPADQGPLPTSADLAAHAHNFVLQNSLDFGIPGALAVGGILVAFFVALVRAYRAAADPLGRAIAVGVAGGMVAFLIYGLTDTIALGARGGIGFWVLLGLGAACGRIAALIASASRADERRYLAGDSAGGLRRALSVAILLVCATPLLALGATAGSVPCSTHAPRPPAADGPGHSRARPGIPQALGVYRSDGLAYPASVAVAELVAYRGCAPEAVALRWFDAGAYARTPSQIERVDAALARQAARLGGTEVLASFLAGVTTSDADPRTLCTLERLRGRFCLPE